MAHATPSFAFHPENRVMGDGDRSRSLRVTNRSQIAEAFEQAGRLELLCQFEK
jgi:hypothetical protein